MKCRDLDLLNLLYSSLTSAGVCWVGTSQPAAGSAEECVVISPSRGRIREVIENSTFCTMESWVGRHAAEIRHRKVWFWKQNHCFTLFIQAHEQCPTLSYRPTTSTSTACCTAECATVSFSASTNRYVFERWWSSGAEMHVCGAQSCLNARTSIQSALSFIAA